MINDRNLLLFSGVRNLQVLLHHEAKGQNIPKENVVDLDPEVIARTGPANPKRRNEDDQAAINHHTDHEVIDLEVDLEIEIWRNRVNTVVNVGDIKYINIDENITLCCGYHRPIYRMRQVLICLV